MQKLEHLDFGELLKVAGLEAPVETRENLDHVLLLGIWKEAEHTLNDGEER